MLGSMLGFGSSLLGGLFSGNAAKQQRKMAQEMREAAWKSFSPMSVQGLGGTGVDFTMGSDGGISGINVSGGVMDPIFGGIASYLGGTGLDQLATSGQLNPMFQQGMDLAGGINPDTMSAFQANLEGLIPGAQSAYEGLQDPNSLFGANAQSSMMGRAEDFLSQAQDFDTVYNNQLGLLRESARPGEERAGAQFLERMYGSGNIGTTGGARNAAEFNLGLERADIDRQMGAHGLSTQRQNQLFSQSMGLFGQAQGMAGLQDQLLGSAMNRFQGLNSLAAGMSQQRFDNQSGLAGLLSGLGQTAGMLPFQQQAAALGLMGAGGQAMSGFQNMAMVPAEMALNFMTNQANARNSVSGYASDIIGSAGGSAGGWGDFFGTLGSNLPNLGDLFPGNNNSGGQPSG